MTILMMSWSAPSKPDSRRHSRARTVDVRLWPLRAASTRSSATPSIGHAARRWTSIVRSVGLVLRIGHFLQPLHRLAVEHFLNREVRHGRGWSGAMPVLLVRWKPDDVARTDLLDRPTSALDQAEAIGDDQRLTQRMGVPRGASTGFEGDLPCGHAC